MLGFLHNSFNNSAVPLESPSRWELSKIVANHIFGDINADKLATIVDIKGSTDKLGRDLTVSGPSIEWTTNFT